MMDKNIKQRLDNELEDIYVTEELKRKTLEKCKSYGKHHKEIWLWNKWSKGAALICSFALVFSCSYLLASKSMNEQGKNYSINDKSKGEVTQREIEEKLKKDVAMNNYSIPKENIQVSKAEKPEAKEYNSKSIKEKTTSYDKKNEVKKDETKKPEVKETKEKAEQNNNSSLENKNQEEKIIAARSLEKNTIELKIEEAEKFWDGKILFPSYIPEGFKLDNIDTYEKDNKKFISIIYKAKDNYFLQIEQVKGEDSKVALDNMQNFSTLRGVLQQIGINKDGVLYTIKGNMSKDVLEEIIKSMK